MCSILIVLCSLFHNMCLMYVYDVHFYTELVVCNEEEDNVYNILWPSTLGGRYNIQPCSGDGATGMYSKII